MQQRRPASWRRPSWRPRTTCEPARCPRARAPWRDPDDRGGRRGRPRAPSRRRDRPGHPSGRRRRSRGRRSPASRRSGSPASMASSRTIPNPSQREVWTNTSARSSQSRVSIRPGQEHRVVEAELRDERARLLLERTGAEDREHRLRVRGADARRTLAAASRDPSERSGGRSRAAAATSGRSPSSGGVTSDGAGGRLSSP